MKNLGLPFFCTHNWMKPDQWQMWTKKKQATINPHFNHYAAVGLQINSLVLWCPMSVLFLYIPLKTRGPALFWPELNQTQKYCEFTQNY